MRSSRGPSSSPGSGPADIATVGQRPRATAARNRPARHPAEPVEARRRPLDCRRTSRAVHSIYPLHEYPLINVELEQLLAVQLQYRDALAVHSVQFHVEGHVDLRSSKGCSARTRSTT